MLIRNLLNSAAEFILYCTLGNIYYFSSKRHKCLFFCKYWTNCIKTENTLYTLLNNEESLAFSIKQLHKKDKRIGLLWESALIVYVFYWCSLQLSKYSTLLNDMWRGNTWLHCPQLKTEEPIFNPNGLWHHNSGIPVFQYYATTLDKIKCLGNISYIFYNMIKIIHFWLDRKTHLD